MDDVHAEEIVIMTVEHLAVIEEVNYLRDVVKQQAQDIKDGKVIIKYLEQQLANLIEEKYA